MDLLRKNTVVVDLEWDNTDHALDLRSLLELVVVRPIRLLLTEPLVIMVAIISAVS